MATPPLPPPAPLPPSLFSGPLPDRCRKWQACGSTEFAGMPPSRSPSKMARAAVVAAYASSPAGSAEAQQPQPLLARRSSPRMPAAPPRAPDACLRGACSCPVQLAQPREPAPCGALPIPPPPLPLPLPLPLPPPPPPPPPPLLYYRCSRLVQCRPGCRCPSPERAAAPRRRPRKSPRAGSGSTPAMRRPPPPPTRRRAQRSRRSPGR